MTNIDYEKDLIAASLQQVNGYLDCERIIIQFIRRHLEKGLDDARVIKDLKTVNNHLEAVMETTGDANVQMNYRYVIGFINTLLRTPAWRSWVQSIQV